MSKTRTVAALQLALGAIGVLATALALVLASRGVTLRVSSWQQIAEACGSFLLPELSLSSALALLLGSVALLVLVLAGHSAGRQVRATRRFLAGLRVADLGSGGTGRADGVTVFETGEPRAFCAGYLRPRVFISTGALAALDPDQLNAVLEHEFHHAARRDPLRLFITGMLASSMFFLPALRHLAARAAALAELDADAAAVRGSGGDGRPLAGALLAFGARSDTAVVGIAAERVDQLMGAPVRWHLPMAAVLWTAAIAAVVVVVEIRATQAAETTMVSLPLLAAELCMVVMAAAPIALGALALLGGGRRAARRGRQHA